MFDPTMSKAPQMSKRTFVVVAEDGPEIFDTLRESIEDHGFEIEPTLRTLGMVFGSNEDGHVEEIRHLRDVGSVSEELTVQVPSPDSDEPC